MCFPFILLQNNQDKREDLEQITECISITLEHYLERRNHRHLFIVKSLFFFFFEQESFVVSLKIHNFGLDGMYYCLIL